MPVSPEQQKANQAVGQAYGDAGATVDNQKAALLTAIAQAGDAGAKAHQAQQAQVGQQRVAALGQLNQAAGVPQGGAFGQQLQQTVAEPMNVAEVVGAGNNPSGYYQGTSKLNSDYMDAVKAAVPIQQEWTQRQANSIAAQAQQEREVREAQLLREREARAAAARQAEADKLYPVKLSDGTTVMVSGASALANDRQRTDLSLGEKQEAERVQRNARRQLLGGIIGESTPMNIIDQILGEADTLEEALSGLAFFEQSPFYRTPGGNKLSTPAMRSYLKQIFGVAPMQKPAARRPAAAAPQRVAIMSDRGSAASRFRSGLGRISPFG